jgi:hypothetical protein
MGLSWMRNQCENAGAFCFQAVLENSGLHGNRVGASVGAFDGQHLCCGAEIIATNPPGIAGSLNFATAHHLAIFVSKLARVVSVGIGAALFLQGAFSLVVKPLEMVHERGSVGAAINEGSDGSLSIFVEGGNFSGIISEPGLPIINSEKRIT